MWKFNLNHEEYFRRTVLLLFLLVVLFFIISFWILKYHSDTESENLEKEYNDTVYSHWSDWLSQEQKDDLFWLETWSWDYQWDDFIVEDDFTNMRLIIPSLNIDKSIIDSNWKWLSKYYVTIRQNIWLEWSLPWNKWKTLLWAHSSSPTWNPTWIEDIFKDLEHIEDWSEVIIETDKYRYKYKTFNKFVWEKKKNVNWILNYTKSNQLVLHTCPQVDDPKFWDHLVFVEAKIEDIIKKEVVIDDNAQDETE